MSEVRPSIPRRRKAEFTPKANYEDGSPATRMPEQSHRTLVDFGTWAESSQRKIWLKTQRHLAVSAVSALGNEAVVPKRVYVAERLLHRATRVYAAGAGDAAYVVYGLYGALHEMYGSKKEFAFLLLGRCLFCDRALPRLRNRFVEERASGT